MADSGKIAGGVVVLGVAALLGGGWFLMGRQSPASAPTPILDGPEPVEAGSADPVATAPPERPAVRDDAEPGSVEARIADLQAQWRDEQAVTIAEATELGGRIKAQQAAVAELEAQVLALRDGKLARLDTRQDKQGERCDPAEPESRACKRQAALRGKQQDAEAGVSALQEQIAAGQAQVEALLAERATALRAVDEIAERQRSDPELVRLYTQLAQER